jgi:hypothetical protein
MIKLNLNKPFVDLDNKPVENTNMGKLLAKVLSKAVNRDPFDCYRLGLSLNKGEEISISKSDVELIRQVVMATGFSAIVKVQLLNELNKEVTPVKPKKGR